MEEEKEYLGEILLISRNVQQLNRILQLLDECL